MAVTRAAMPAADAILASYTTIDASKAVRVSPVMSFPQADLRRDSHRYSL